MHVGVLADVVNKRLALLPYLGICSEASQAEHSSNGQDWGTGSCRGPQGEYLYLPGHLRWPSSELACVWIKREQEPAQGLLGSPLF